MRRTTKLVGMALLAGLLVSVCGSPLVASPARKMSAYANLPLAATPAKEYTYQYLEEVYSCRGLNDLGQVLHYNSGLMLRDTRTGKDTVIGNPGPAGTIPDYCFLTNSGTVIGLPGQQSDRFWSWKNGVVSRSSVLTTGFFYAEGVLDTGAAVGVFALFDGRDGAAIWDVTGDPQLLPLPTGYRSDVWCVSRGGQIVGKYYHEYQPEEGKPAVYDEYLVRWANGKLEETAQTRHDDPPGGWEWRVLPCAVNDAGDILLRGDIHKTGNGYGLAVWHRGTLTDVPITGAPGDWFAMNKAGTVIGSDGNGAFIWDAKKGLRRINDIVYSQPPGPVHPYCSVLNAGGDTVASFSTDGRLYLLKHCHGFRGRVTDAGGAPVPTASVEATPLDFHGAWPYYAYADGNGDYAIPDVPDGRYRLTVAKAGCRFSSPSSTVSISATTPGAFVDFQGKAASADGKVTYRALLIAGPPGSLKYVENDVKDMRYALLSGENWQNNNIVILPDDGSKATLLAIHNAIARMAQQADGDDVCLIYFSGHGDRMHCTNEKDKLEGVLIADPKGDDLYQGRIVDDMFAHWVNGLPTRTHVVVLDCCFSGEMIAGGSGTAGHDDAGAAMAAIMGALFRPLGDRVSDLYQHDCGIGMVSSRATEISYEEYLLHDGRTLVQNGTFTYFLAEQSLLGRLGDANHDGWVSGFEAFTGAAKGLKAEIAKNPKWHRQTPQGWTALPPTDLKLLGPLDLPDASLRAGAAGKWTGEGVFTTDQSDWRAQVADAVAPGGTLKFQVRVSNPSRAAHDVVVTGVAWPSPWKVTFYSAATGGANITAQITGKAGWVVKGLAPGASRTLRLEVELAAGAAHPGSCPVVVEAAWRGEVDKTDLVKADIHGVSATRAPAAQVSGLAAVPSRGGAQVTFSLSSEATVQARILNLAGRPVKTLCRDRACDAGANTLLWNAQSDAGLAVPSGTYLIELVARGDDGSQSRALTMVRISR